MSDLVSIILPTYNRAHLVMNAINSVLTQTYQNWELIIWDDGSTDDTEKVLAALSDSRIRCFRDANHGMSYALNRGLDLATGDLIAFLDDDDTWLPETLKIQVSVMEKFPQIDLVFGNFNNVSIEDHSQNIGFDQTAESISQLITQKIDADLWLINQGFLKAVSRDNFIAFDTVICRKSVIDSLGPFNENLRNGMDFEFWWRFGLAGLQPAYTDKIILNRNKYPGSLSGRTLIALDNRIKTLDCCAYHSESMSREDTLEYLKPAYRNAWQNKIILFGTMGEKGNAWQAFIKSLKYGFSPGSVKLILQSLISPDKNKT